MSNKESQNISEHAEFTRSDKNRIFRQLKQIKELIIKMATDQEKLAAAVASENADLSAIGQDLTDIATAVATVSAQVAAIIAAGPGVPLDFTALTTAQASLDAQSAALGKVAGAVTAIVPPKPPAA